MKRTNAKTVGEIINEVLRHERLDTKLDEHRAAALWPEIVGAGINSYTESCTVKNGVMTVRITSSALRNDLQMSRSSIISRINEMLGREVISEIIFR